MTDQEAVIREAIIALAALVAERDDLKLKLRAEEERANVMQHERDYCQDVELADAFLRLDEAQTNERKADEERDQAVAERDRYRDALDAIAHHKIVTEEIGRYDAPTSATMVRRLSAHEIARAALAVSTP